MVIAVFVMYLLFVVCLPLVRQVFTYQVHKPDEKASPKKRPSADDGEYLIMFILS